MLQENPTSPHIEALWTDHQALVQHLQSNGEWTLSSRVEEAFAKTLIIAAASYFEIWLTESILGIYRTSTSGFEQLVEFVRTKAIGQGFAQLFTWGKDGRPSHNANYFYSFFGGEFSLHMKELVRQDKDLDDSVRAFLEIGNLRNHMVHGDYANFTVEKTATDVYKLYEKATLFLAMFPQELERFSS